MRKCPANFAWSHRASWVSGGLHDQGSPIFRHMLHIPTLEEPLPQKGDVFFNFSCWMSKEILSKVFCILEPIWVTSWEFQLNVPLKENLLFPGNNSTTGRSVDERVQTALSFLFGNCILNVLFNDLNGVLKRLVKHFCYGHECPISFWGRQIEPLGVCDEESRIDTCTWIWYFDVIPGENDLKRDLGTRQHSSSCQVLVCSEWWKTQFAWKYQQSACCWRGDSPRQIEG